MVSINDVQEASMGFTDKAVGLFREAFGTFTGQESIADAGRAQQDRGTERLRALQHEAKADAQRAKAAAQDKIERAQQGKDSRSDLSGNGKSEFAKGGPREAVESFTERVKGGAKEAIGAIGNNERLRREGEAQQSKADAKANAAKEESKAEAARAKVRAADARQQSAESAS